MGLVVTAPWLRSVTARTATPKPGSRADDEPAVVEAARAGDRKAFEQLYRKHAQSVFARLTRLVGPIQEREDLMQQVFLELHRALPRYRGDAPLGAYLHGIVVRVAYEHLRRAMRRPQIFRDDQMVDLVPPASSPETTAREREQLALAFTRLAKLKPKKRVAFVLNVIEGLSLAEMAGILQVDARTLGQRVAYARRELAAMFERDEKGAFAKDGGRQ